MFLPNKYTKLYWKIINDSNTFSGYTEVHHKIPKSLGGSNDQSNLIRLSARKHFLCHYLLTKMFLPNTREWYKMVRAFMFMSSNPSEASRYINSRLYESKRSAFSFTQSKLQSGENNSQFKKIWVSYNSKDKKIQPHELEDYLSKGYSLGRHKKPNNKKEDRLNKKNIKHEQTKTLLLPLYQRYKNGESLRSISKDYGKSHVYLYKQFSFFFEND